MSARAIVIAGPTAVGKTALALELAARIGGEIVSADSMQVYRGMDVGTAKPSCLERAQSAFHLLDVADPDAQFTVADWKQLAYQAIADIRHRGRVPILCGGTGMYLRALLSNWSLAQTPRDAGLRVHLEAEAELLGSLELHRRLEHVDPVTARRLHPNDRQRIIRALEVCIVSGRPLSELHEQDRSLGTEGLDAFQFALTLPRDSLYSRIDKRVDSMMSQGLVHEVKGLLSRGYSAGLPSMRGLGYKEVCAYLVGKSSLDVAVELIKRNTRRYAKRQLTWFRADAGINWIDLSIVHSAQAVSRIAQSAGF